MGWFITVCNYSDSMLHSTLELQYLWAYLCIFPAASCSFSSLNGTTEVKMHILHFCGLQAELHCFHSKRCCLHLSPTSRDTYLLAGNWFFFFLALRRLPKLKSWIDLILLQSSVTVFLNNDSISVFPGYIYSVKQTIGHCHVRRESSCAYRVVILHSSVFEEVSTLEGS